MIRSIPLLCCLWLQSLADGAMIWSASGESSITAIRGKSATMTWSINLTDADANLAWIYVKIRNIDGDITTDLVIFTNTGDKTVRNPSYQSRGSDLTSNITQTGSVVTIMFTMANLRTTDEMKYRPMLGFAFDSTSLSGVTLLVVQVLPESTSISISPNQTGFCRESLVTISCTSYAKPPAKYSLYHNTKLVHNESTSGVFSVTLNDTGKNNYICVPYNILGFGQNRSLELLVKEPPRISDCKIISRNMINGSVIEGERVTMSCNISGSEPLNKSWTNGSHVWNQLSLTFVSVNRANDGYYHVTVNNGKECNEAKGENLTLAVYFTASCIIQQGLRYVTEGNVVTINISSTGNPPVNDYIWTHPNGSRLTGNSTITFTPSRQDSGTYHCSVYNGVGERGNCTQIINVQYPTDRITCSNKTVLEGEDVQLVCSANGNPPPDVMWRRNGNIRGMGSKLLIKGVTRSDDGKYAVLANNSLGYQTIEIFMIVQSRAKSPEIMNPYKQVLVVDAGDYVSLVCNASGYPVPNITWTMDGTLIGVGRIFNIRRAKRNDSSCYRCTANNGIGHPKNASICLNVQYPPSTISILPSRRQIILKEGNRLHLNCKSDSNPSPTYTWKHDGVTLADGQNGTLVLNSINRRQNGTYQCEAKNHLGFLHSVPIEIVVQYLDDLVLIGSSNKSYSQTNPLVLFNLSVNAYPSNAFLSCNPSAPNILTVITSHDAGISGKQYLVVVIIKNDEDRASIVCKVDNGVDVREKTLHYYRRPILFKETFAGQFRITNQEWQDELKDAKSTGYNDLKKKCLKILQAAYDGIPYLAPISIKEFVKGSIIVRFELEVIGQVPDPLLPLRDYIKEQGGDINGSRIDNNSIQKSSDLKDNSPIEPAGENKTLVVVLAVLLALSIVLNIIFIVGFLWLRRKDSKGNSGKRSKISDERGQMNDISLQETSFTATDNATPNVPEYEPIGRRGLATSNAGIPQYEAVTTRTQPPQPQSGVQSNNPMPQYESADGHRQTETVVNPPPVTYQTIQPRTGDYGSLSPLTRSPPAVLSSTGSPTHTGEYQALQHRGVSPQYQSLDDLSKC